MPDLPLMDDVRGLDLGISLKTGLDIRVGLDTDSEDSATKLSEMLRKALKLAMKDMQGPSAAKGADLAAAAKKIQIAADKSDVHLTLRLDAAEVERGLAEAARRQQADKAALAVTLTPHRVPAPPPPKQTIHIEGLDDGPKEIPLAQ